MFSERCDCDVDTVIHALDEHVASEPILQMFITEEDAIDLEISGDIGIRMNGEDGSEDEDDIPVYGIVAMSSGIASLASSLYNDGMEPDEVLRIVEANLRQAFENVDFPEVEVNISLIGGRTMPMRDGKILRFPS